jgi:hypothetical protein
MSLADLVIAAVVLSGATYLLYRSLWKGQGSCHGCTSGGCRPRPRDQAELVRLGQPRRPADPTPPSGVAAARLPDGPPTAR